MATFAVVSGGVVTSVISADTLADAELATKGATCIEYTDANPAGIGYTYNATTGIFTAPVAPPPVAPTISTEQQDLQNLLGGLQAQITQAQADLSTLSASTDPLAPIIARSVNGALALARAVADITVILGFIEASQVPTI